MKIIKQNKLLSSLLTSDILYFPTASLKNKDSNFFSNKIELNNKTTKYILLNVSVLLQSIKQIIRLLQFNLKYYKNSVQIITSSNLYNQIIEHLSKSYGTKDSKINARLKFDNKLNSKVVTYIGNDITSNISHLMYKTFNNNINSIILINSLFNKNLFGNYKIFNNINNYKKLLFLIVIILLSQNNSDKLVGANVTLKKN